MKVLVLFFILSILPVAQANDEWGKLLLSGKRLEAVKDINKQIRSTKRKSKKRSLIRQRNLFAKQFISSNAQQTFLLAKGFAKVKRWQDCLREIGNIDAKDKTNFKVVTLEADCFFKSNKNVEATKKYKVALKMIPDDQEVVFKLVELYIKTKRYDLGLSTLKNADTVDRKNAEEYAILKSRIFVGMSKRKEAIRILKTDHEKNLDHVRVLYELGSLYATLPGNDWRARKFLSLFLTRCKDFTDEDLKKKRLDDFVTQAQKKLKEVDKKLGV